MREKGRWPLWLYELCLSTMKKPIGFYICSVHFSFEFGLIWVLLGWRGPAPSLFICVHEPPNLVFLVLSVCFPLKSVAPVLNLFLGFHFLQSGSAVPRDQLLPIGFICWYRSERLLCGGGDSVSLSHFTTWSISQFGSQPSIDFSWSGLFLPS
jgi:hypothetical protein